MQVVQGCGKSHNWFLYNRIYMESADQRFFLHECVLWYQMCIILRFVFSLAGPIYQPACMRFVIPHLFYLSANFLVCQTGALWDIARTLTYCNFGQRHHLYVLHHQKCLLLMIHITCMWYHSETLASLHVCFLWYHDSYVISQRNFQFATRVRLWYQV